VLCTERVSWAVGGEPRPLTAASTEGLNTALLDGTVSRSTDGGRSWEKAITP
jgi:hypothetical protein